MPEPSSDQAVAPVDVDEIKRSVISALMGSNSDAVGRLQDKRMDAGETLIDAAIDGILQSKNRAGTFRVGRNFRDKFNAIRRIDPERLLGRLEPF